MYRWFISYFCCEELIFISSFQPWVSLPQRPSKSHLKVTHQFFRDETFSLIDLHGKGPKYPSVHGTRHKMKFGVSLVLYEWWGRSSMIFFCFEQWRQSHLYPWSPFLVSNFQWECKACLHTLHFTSMTKILCCPENQWAKTISVAFLLLQAVTTLKSNKIMTR